MNKTPWYVVIVLLSGCASPAPLPEHTLFLGEVVALAPSDLSEGGLEHAGEFAGFPDELFRSCGIGRDRPDAETLALLRFSYYWHNGGAQVRELVRWYPLGDGVEVSAGNLVEIELLTGAGGPDTRCPRVSRRVSKDLDSGGCEYRAAEAEGVRRTLGLLSPIGAAGSASMDCPGLEATGWRPRGFGYYGASALVRMPTDGAAIPVPDMPGRPE